ncbi:MAG: hypothetical protein ACXWE7_10645 [Nitrososphaeraceae archaeon]
MATPHFEVAGLEPASIGPKPIMFPITPHHMPNVGLEPTPLIGLVFETNASTFPPIRHNIYIMN